jgi:drug/metabolite transporter (DMT)-like permease
VSRKELLPYLWMLCGSGAFALMGTCAHALGDRCGWQVIAFVRCLIPLLCAGTLAWAGRVQLVFWRPRTLWVRSIAGSVSLVGTFFALTRLPVSDVFTLTNLFPLWVALLSWPLLGELPPGHVWLAAVSGVLGIVLIQQPHLAEGNFAALVALGCSLSTAAAMIGLHRLRGIDATAIVAHFSAVALLLCLVCFFLFERALPILDDLDAWTVLLLLGIGGMATAGQLCLTKAFTAGTPSRVAVVGLTQILFAMALDRLLWDQPFGPVKLAGMALVIAPTAWLMVYRT